MQNYLWSVFTKDLLLTAIWQQILRILIHTSIGIVVLNVSDRTGWIKINLFSEKTFEEPITKV